MTEERKRQIDTIADQMHYGKWTIAINDYKMSNITAQELEEYLNDKGEDYEEILGPSAGMLLTIKLCKDFALLGLHVMQEMKA
jgi:hypothetical protein